MSLIRPIVTVKRCALQSGLILWLGFGVGIRVIQRFMCMIIMHTLTKRAPVT